MRQLLSISHRYLRLSFLALAAVSISSAASPYAPEKVGYTLGDNDVAEYTYDKAGKRISDSKGQTITYGLIGKAEDIETPTGIVSFRHGPGGGRYLRKDPNGDTTFYVGGREHCVPADGGPSKSTIHVRNGSYSLVAQLEISSGNTDYVYHLRDHQGTPLVSVDDTGTVLSERRYDVWGMARDIDGADATLDKSVRGYTGHENIPSADLIQANGRIYDPKAKQFTSADPVIFAGNLVSHNRYAYGLNSPNDHTDITGYVSTRAGMRPSNRRGAGAANAGNAARGQPPMLSLFQPGSARGNGLDRSDSGRTFASGFDRRSSSSSSSSSISEATFASGFSRSSSSSSSSSSDTIASDLDRSVSSGSTVFLPIDILQRDANNDPIFRSVKRARWQYVKRAKAWARTQKVSLRTQDGFEIPARLNRGRNMKFDCDCHGYTAAEGKFWINNTDMQEYLNHTTILTRTSQPVAGDWVVYRNDAGDVVHSAILGGHGQVTMAAGSVLYRGPDGRPTKLATVPIDDAWTEFGTTKEYWTRR